MATRAQKVQKVMVQPIVSRLSFKLVFFWLFSFLMSIKHVPARLFRHKFLCYFHCYVLCLAELDFQIPADEIASRSLAVREREHAHGRTHCRIRRIHEHRLGRCRRGVPEVENKEADRYRSIRIFSLIILIALISSRQGRILLKGDNITLIQNANAEVE